MVRLAALPVLPVGDCQGHRLVNSKFPPIHIFDDVASVEEFEALHEIQALTNPRLQTEMGNLGLISTAEIPFGIPGCAYATAPFTHINPDGSRFSDGRFGVLYIADTPETALAEVRYHQEAYWRNVPDLGYERFVFRGLACQFEETGMTDVLVIPREDPIYAAHDYAASRALGQTMKAHPMPGLRYHSVRRPGATCWALMTPKPVSSLIQTAHYEMIWNGEIASVSRISSASTTSSPLSR